VVREAQDMRPMADFLSILLMFQFVSHSAQQMRDAKGLLEGLPCPNVCDDQVRRPVAVQLKPLATVGNLRDLIPYRFKSGAEEYTDDFFVIDDQNRRHGKKHSCYSL
jgi:hypothetical protein